MNITITNEEICLYHNKAISSFNLPQWITNQTCPKCNEKLNLISFRSVGLKLNAKDIGNFFVDICCSKCNYGYELHLQNKISNIIDFSNALKNQDFTEENSFIPEFQIDKLENNLTSQILKEKYGNKKEQ